MKVYLSPSNQPNNKCILGHSEKQHCEELVQKMIPYLVAKGIQYKLRNPGVSMTASCREADKWGADLYLPLHTNATSNGRARGTTFGFYPGRVDSMNAGKVFAEFWKKIYPLPNLVRVGTYTFLEAREPKAPSVYIELLFHDNLEDATYLHNNMNLIAQNLVDAIHAYGLRVVNPPAVPPAIPVTPEVIPNTAKSPVEGHIVKFKISKQENAEFFNKPLGYVVSLPIEEYLMGVVPAEIGNYHIEACKAQAIAARSLAYYWTKSGAVITDTTQHQAYRGPRSVDKAFFNAHNAVKETKGQVLMYNGSIAQTYYADSNGGKMKSSKEHWVADLPYLVTKDDPWTLASGKPFNGHPVGMSQWGAIYAANQGIKHPEILAFYYPGTTIVPKVTVTPPVEEPVTPPVTPPTPPVTPPVIPPVTPPVTPPKEDESMDYLYSALVKTRISPLNIWKDARKGLSLKKVPKGSVLFVLEETNKTWAKVRYGTVVGYSDRQYLERIAEPLLYKREGKIITIECKDESQANDVEKYLKGFAL